MKDNSIILKNSVILFIRLVFTALLGVITTRLLVNGLGASDFGLYNVVGGIVVMMAFLNTVMITTTFRFISFEMGKNNQEGINKVFNISLVIHLLMAVVLILLTETIGVYYINNYLNVDPSKLSDALFVLRFSSYAIVFSIISIPFQGLVTANEKFLIQASIEVLRAVFVLIVAIIVFVYAGNKLRNYALLMMLVSIVPATLFIAYCKSKYKEVTKWQFQTDKLKYKEMIGFSGWVMFGAAASLGRNQGSSLIINSFFGTVLNAAFGVAYQLDGLVRMLASTLGQAVVPQITKSFSAGNTERSVSLVAYMSKYTSFMMLIVALPLLLETEYLLKLWIGEIPPYTIIFSQLIILSSLVDSFGGGIIPIVQATGKIKYFQIFLSITTLLSLPIAYFLFKAGYPPSYLSIAFISTVTLNVVIRQVLYNKIIALDIRFLIKTSYLRVLYVVLMLLPLFYFKSFFNPGFVRFVFFSIFSVCWLIMSIYILGIEKNEKIVIKQFATNLLNLRLKK